MDFKTYDFDYRKIRVEIEELPTFSKKKAYLLFLQKELKRVIRCFESNRFTPWKVKAEDCSERNKFIEERYSIYNDVYRKDQHDNNKYVDEDIKNKTEELKDLAKALDDELNFISTISAIREERNLDDFKTLWEELTENYFDLKVLLQQFEQVGEDREDEYIEYCVRRFRHRTIDEWMRFYATKNLTENIESLKKANLSPELEYKNTIRITNARFEESTLGQWVRENLESFEKKFVKENRSDEIEKKSRIISGRKDDWDFKKEIEKILDGLIEADTGEEKIYKDIEYWESISKVKDRGADDIWMGESWEIAVGMLKTFINDLKQAQVTGYYKGKKIDFIAADRLNKFLSEVIKEIESRNKKDEYVEMEKVNIEEIKAINTDKNIDVNIDANELPAEENEKQRDKIKQFLLANYKDFDTNLLLNLNGIAYEITDFYYPKLTKPERKKKKESLRQELMLFRNGKIPLK